MFNLFDSTVYLREVVCKCGELVSISKIKKQDFEMASGEKYFNSTSDFNETDNPIGWSCIKRGFKIKKDCRVLITRIDVCNKCTSNYY